MASRGNYGKNVAENSFWWEGPECFKFPHTEWPKFEENNQDLEQYVMKEEKVSKSNKAIIHVMVNSEVHKSSNILEIIDINRYNNKQKIVRILAWVIKFKNNLKSSISKKYPEKDMESEILADEGTFVEEDLIRV